MLIFNMDINFDLEDIRKESSSELVFERGRGYFKTGRVAKVSEKRSANEIFVSALVMGSLNSYGVHVCININGYLTNYSCSCKAFKEQHGFCKHIVALLIDIYSTSKLKKKLIITGSNKTNKVAEKMIDIFEKKAYEEINTDNMQAEYFNEVTIMPKLIVEYNQIYRLTFSIGLRRLYIIKNLGEFVENITNKRDFAYGKDLRFTHEISSFTQEDIPLVEFIVKEVTNLKNILKSIDKYGYYGSRHTDSKSLFLTPAALDKFLDITTNRTINLEILDEKDKVLVKDQTPPLKFELKKTQKGASIQYNSNQGIITFSGDKKMYIYKKGGIYRCEDDLTNLIIPIFTTLDEVKSDSLELTGKVFNKFAAYVLPKLEKYNLIDVDKNLYDNMEIVPLKTKIFFDREKEVITADVKFCYGDTEIRSAEKNTDAKLFRNSIDEYKILKKLTSIGFELYEKRKQYILIDENKIFNLIQTDLEELKELAEIYLTDSFRNMVIKYPQPVKLGIRIKGSLLEISFDTSDFDTDELVRLIESHRLKKKYHRLRDGSFLSVDNDEIKSAHQLVEGLNISDKDLKKGSLLLPKYRALYIDNLIRNNESIAAERDSAFKRMTHELRDFSDMDFSIPNSLDKILRSYQKTGFRWLKTLAEYNLGGILADDMGLGKTLQVVAMFLYEKEQWKVISAKNPDEEALKTSIVVAPTSLVYNWQREIERFAPEITTMVLAGIAVKRDEMIKEINDYDVVITSYDTLKRDIEKYDNMYFKYIIVDEAQNIKNANTQNAKAVKLLNAENRFALTGTPIENSLSEIWSIFDFLMPGYLYTSSKFQKLFETPIVKNNDESKTEDLRKHIAPFVLRRLKKDVLKELPDKIETVMLAEMTPEQKKLYTAYLLKARGEMEREIAINGFSQSQIKILALLTRMRQICCHPALFTEDYSSGSGKFELLDELIADCIGSGHRILLFSQFTSMLRLIIANLSEKNIKFFYLDGSTSAKERISMVDKFNAGEKDLFLISLKAGGTGLNLTGADVVIHYDPWWNPAVQNQATDRAYRFGQKNKVQVFNLVTKDTIEEKIMSLQDKKRDLTDSVIKEGTSFISKMSPDEIRALFEDK